MPADECHTHERWGSVNISKCEDIIARSKVAPQRVPIDAGLKKSVRDYGIDQAWVDSMSIQRRNKPIIFVVAGDGAHVINGAHRLQACMYCSKASSFAEISMISAGLVASSSARCMSSILMTGAGGRAGIVSISITPPPSRELRGVRSTGSCL
jgi:hypothetical protein